MLSEGRVGDFWLSAVTVWGNVSDLSIVSAGIYWLQHPPYWYQMLVDCVLNPATALFYLFCLFVFTIEGCCRILFKTDYVILTSIHPVILICINNGAWTIVSGWPQAIWCGLLSGQSGSWCLWVAGFHCAEMRCLEKVLSLGWTLFPLWCLAWRQKRATTQRWAFRDWEQRLWVPE